MSLQFPHHFLARSRLGACERELHHHPAPLLYRSDTACLLQEFTFSCSALSMDHQRAEAPPAYDVAVASVSRRPTAPLRFSPTLTAPQVVNCRTQGCCIPVGASVDVATVRWRVQGAANIVPGCPCASVLSANSAGVFGAHTAWELLLGGGCHVPLDDVATTVD